MCDKPTQLPVFFYPRTVSREEIWQPLADIYRTPTGWLLKFDLAGIRPEDVTVKVHGCQVNVSGVRRDWLLEEGCSYHSMEISYSRFERRIELPCELSDPQVRLEYRLGILIIRVDTEGRSR